MFTGLVESVGEVVEVTPRRGSRRIGIASCLPTQEMTDGESVAVDGVCLTVSARSKDLFFADVVAETLSRTTLGSVRPKARVNLERSLRLGDRLGGHLLQGHVDTTLLVLDVRVRGDDRRLRVELVPEIRRYVARKGSIALHGVSLTVATVGATAFEVALIPETLVRTTLGNLHRGDRVNVEVDLVVRYLGRLLEERESPSQTLRGAQTRPRGRASKAEGP